MRQVSREAALKSAQGQLESARGKYLGAEAQLKYSEVRSPIAGVVTDRPLFPGETAVIGVPLLTVMDISSLLAKMHMPQSQTQWLRVGDAASVNIPGMEDPVEGKVAVVSPALDPGSTTVEVWVRISNTDNKLRPGTAVHISIAGKSVPKAVVVPVESIVTEPTGKKTVMVLGADGVAHQREVMVGIEDHGFIQILQGVSSGEKLITKGAYALDDGTKVKVVIASDKDTDADKASGSGVTR
jgi:HlyD family secretion protein